MYDLAFPHLNIFIEKLSSGFEIFNFHIAFYGIIVAVGMICGFYVATYIAKKTNQNVDNYYDLFMLIIVFAIIGARIYYVIFNLDYYSKNLKEIINIRAGGLAVYGGVISCFIVCFIFCNIKKLNFFQVIDTCFAGLTVGQVIGRWGNFFNMEAFGTWTDNIFAMRMKYDLLDKTSVDQKMIDNMLNINNIDYVQAHPTFFYELALNLILFIIILLMFFKLYKFYGQIMATYFIGYGLIRFFVESLRTDSLYIPNSNIRVSQVVSLILIILGIVMILYNVFYKSKKLNKYD